jgi:hypothetical protein
MDEPEIKFISFEIKITADGGYCRIEDGILTLYDAAFSSVAQIPLSLVKKIEIYGK